VFPTLLLVHPANFEKLKTAPTCIKKPFYIFKNNGTMRPHSLRWFLSLVHNASPFFFVSLRSVRFGEGEATSVQRYGGRRRHTRYAFALGVRSGVPQVVQIKLIRNLRTDQLDPQIRLTNQVDPQVSI